MLVVNTDRKRRVPLLGFTADRRLQATEIDAVGTADERRKAKEQQLDSQLVQQLDSQVQRLDS